jgi:hypothetical protein
MMTICDRCHPPSFIKAMKAQKKNKDDDMCHHLLCLNGAITRGSEEDNAL